MSIICFKCVKCEKEYYNKEFIYHCSDCGLEGMLDIVLDYDSISNNISKNSLKENTNYTLWRYLPAIPLKSGLGIQPLKVGWTPLYEVKQLRKKYNLPNLFIKDDSVNPTGSLKDRASAVGLAKAIELNKNAICAASTGNAATSISGFAASGGINNYIFVPESAPEAKIAQLLIYGSNVFLVKGTYDEAFDLCYKASESFGWYNRSCAINPFLVEGKKTVAYEICEQLNWEAPDVVVMAVGDGCSIAGAYKGFLECYKLGLTDKVPKIIGIQASLSNPVTRAYENSTYEFDYIKPQTIADSISVGIPRNGIKALKAIEESNGFMVDVDDQDILDSMKILAQNTGIFGEPAGTTGFAGVRKLVDKNLINRNERLVTIVTGNGLKDIQSAIKAAGKPLYVKPDLEEVEYYIKVKEDI